LFDYSRGAVILYIVEGKTTQHENRGVTIMTTELIRAAVLNDAIARLGSARAIEAGTPNVTPEPNKMGYDDSGNPIVGVDYTGGKFRARIRVSDALSGADVRITLYRGESLEDASYAYRAAHVALWGSASYASNDDIMDRIAQARA
jgi:hypothetical protein